MIYFIQGTVTKNIKIGTTRDFYQRFLQLKSSELFICLNLINGEREEEAALHKRFEKYSFQGEWFFPASELLEYINSLPKSEYSGATQDGIKINSKRSLLELAIIDKVRSKAVNVPASDSELKGRLVALGLSQRTNGTAFKAIKEWANKGNISQEDRLKALGLPQESIDICLIELSGIFWY